MRLILMFLVQVLTFYSFSQEVKSFDAEKVIESDYLDYEDYDENQEPIGELIFLKGCSWYCGGNIKSISASSELKKTNNINYSPNNAHDFNKNTAWIEGKTDYGIGEFIEYKFNFDEIKNYNGKLGINKLIIANGYKKSKQIWEENSRIKQLKIYHNDELFAIVNLLDLFEIQIVNIDEIIFPANKTTKLRFEIANIYKGKKYKDTALSLLMFDGVGVH